MNYTQPLKLGEFIEKLQQQPQENRITFDFGGFVPTSFASWRGFYNQLALGYEKPEYNKEITAANLLQLATDTVGVTMWGYKGGSYLMTKETNLWADNYGESTGTAIVDVVTFDGYLTKIITQYINY